MATHDGADFVGDQIDSILEQEGVDVRIIISDDASSDGTPDIVLARASDPRITVLPAGRFGSAQANFYRLIRDADVAGAAGVAFADQDDVWHRDKLRRQLTLLGVADAVSSNVVATFDSRRVRLDKAQPQRGFDYVCESAGPGCTFLLSPSAFSLVRDVVRGDARVDATAAHDWLAYAIVRAGGMRWHIDDEPTVDYRQHSKNVTGANLGTRQARIRLDRIRSGGFREDCARVAEIAADVAEGARATSLHDIARLLRDSGGRARLDLASRVGQLRRRPRDRIVLRGVILLGLW